MEDVVARALAGPRFTARVRSLFAFVGIVIAAIGTYATVVLVVSARRREFGIRLAAVGPAWLASRTNPAAVLRA